MSGNQDRAARARARTEARHDEMQDLLDRAKDALLACAQDATTPVKIHQVIRGVELVAKASLTLEKMAAAPRPARAAPMQTEQDVSKADRDDSPETLQRMRDDLVEHFDRMRIQIERKDAGRQDDGGSAAPDLERPPIAA
ncbi:hypothetical protein ACIQC9_02015 [Brevundimonas sp. NPDC092305]|uniref:hypothetical protein n=1 Tax=Brevundimonas sp. NPDC092305 TaxID=3363957 RepID=UPI00380AF63E